MKKVDEVIAEILVELDNHHATYQRHYRHYYGEEDEKAKSIYRMKVDLCETILQRLRRK